MNAVISPGSLPSKFQVWKSRDKRLWFSGDLTLLEKPSISVIGTRDVSPLGVERAQKVTEILIKNRYVVVSGLARGIDTVAHQTALKLGGKTIAVMGTPIDQCYPKENRALKDRIIRKGLVVSQFPPGDYVRPTNFPRRNELMAALSDMTIVVEAGEKSGVRYQVESAIKFKKPVGFLPSVAQMRYDWVRKAMDSGYGFELLNSKDLFRMLNYRNDTIHDNPKKTRAEQLDIKDLFAETITEHAIKSSQGSGKISWLLRLWKNIHDILTINVI